MFIQHQKFSSLNHDVKGTIAPLKMLDVKLNFEPKFAVDYSSKAYLETDQGNFVIDLVGSCIMAQLDTNDDKKDFGTVGIGHAEFREVVVRNPTALSMTIRAESDNEQFDTDVK
jgi:hypothetical protein